MRRGFVSALIFLSTLLPQGARGQELKVGFFSLPPHVYIVQLPAPAGPDKPRFGGAAHRLFVDVANTMGYSNVSFEEFPLPRLLQKLQAQSIDLALTLGRSKEREEIGFYPDEPFMLMKPGLIMAKDRHTEVDKLAELKKLKLGVYAAGILSPTMRQDGLVLEKLTGDNVSLRAIDLLRLGRLDAFYSPDSYELKHQLHVADKEQSLKLVELADPPNGLYTVFAKKHKNLVAVYQEAVAACLSRKSYESYLAEAASN